MTKNTLQSGHPSQKKQHRASAADKSRPCVEHIGNRVFKAGEDEHRDAEEDAGERLPFAVNAHSGIHEDPAEQRGKECPAERYGELVFHHCDRARDHLRTTVSDRRTRQTRADTVPGKTDRGGDDLRLAVIER